MKIAMLTWEQYDKRRQGSVGSSRIRGTWVQKYAPEIEKFTLGEQYDAVIYQKAYWLDHMRAYQGVKIYDLCDPDWLENRPVTEVIEHCDGVTVPTEELAAYIRQITSKPVMVIPDRIDPEQHQVTKLVHAGPIKTAVWFGYSGNAKVLLQVEQILKARDIKLITISDRRYLPGDAYIKYEYPKVHEDLINYDVAILPTLPDNLRFKYKSNNKDLTCYALKLPVVKELADLDRLNDPEVRKKEVEIRYNEAITTHHAKHSGPEYVTFINNIMRSKNG